MAVKAMYSVAELGRKTGIERRRMARLLEGAGVRITRSGNRRHVALTELSSRMGNLIPSAELARVLRDAEKGSRN